MILDFAKRALWHPDYPIRRPVLCLRKAFRSPYESWLRGTATLYASERFEFENRKLEVENKKFSLITLVYHPKPEHFEVCSRSVLSQSYTNFEWTIVVNGAASNRVLNLLNTLKAHPRVKVILPNEPLGIANSTALAAERSSGQWLAFLDHDDRLDPSALSDVAKVAAFRPETQLIYTDSDLCDDVGRRYSPWLKPGPSLEYILSTNYVCHFHSVRREFFLTHQVATSEYDGSQDWDLSLKAMETPECVYHIPKILYTQRVHPAQYSSHVYRRGDSVEKDQVIASQARVLQSYLKRRNIETIYALQAMEARGTYYLTYVGKAEPPVTIFGSEETVHATEYKNVMVRAIKNGDTLEDLLSQVSTPYFAWISPEIRIKTKDWLRQAIGVMERNPQITRVGGSVSDRFGRTQLPKLVENLKSLPPGTKFRYDMRREVSAVSGLWYVGRVKASDAVLAYDPSMKAVVAHSFMP